MRRHACPFCRDAGEEVSCAVAVMAVPSLGPADDASVGGSVAVIDDYLLRRIMPRDRAVTQELPRNPRYHLVMVLSGQTGGCAVNSALNGALMLHYGSP